jgi:myosin heavy subunit
MAKILSVLTLIFALAATYLGFQSKGRVEELAAAGERKSIALASTQGELKKTKEKLTATEEDLTQTKAEVEKAKEALRASEAEVTKAKGELDTKVGELAAVQKELADIKDKISRMTPAGGDDLAKQVADMQAKTTELDNKNKELEIVKAELTTRVETLSDQRKELDQKIATQTTVIDRYQKNIMAKGTRGRVLAVNSGWGFVVLSVGDRQGAAANKIMVVVRDGQSIGRVKITNVESSQSVADIIPSSFVRGMYVQPGDDVIFTGDDKVREEQVADAAGAAGPANSPALPKP